MKAKPILGVLLVSLALLFTLPSSAQTPSSDNNSAAANQAPQLPPIDQLVTMTCRQAWHAGGKTQEGFFAIVQQLTELSAKNRGVTIPDDQAAGQRAGEWIRTQALKDPDQLLYAVVDHAVQYSIKKGTAKAATAAPSGK